MREARYIAENIKDEDLDKAFNALPDAVRDQTIDDIKQHLKARRKHLEKYARQYYKVLQKTVLVVGTDKKDKFVITRKGNDTQVQVYRVKKEGEELIMDRTYSCPETRELWIYGLTDQDVFQVSGYGKRKIRLRILGGQDNDTYLLSTGRKVTVYDFKSNDLIENPAGAKVVLSNDYEVNAYDYEKPEYNIFAGYPMAGFNPDDGVKIGAVVNYTVNGFNRFPYSQRHSVKGNFFFATGGFELGYKGLFPRALGKWDFILDGLYTSPNFSINYFGMGNETENYQREVGRNFNRVKIRTMKVTPALQRVGEMGGSLTARLSFERIQVANTPGRFVTIPTAVNPDVFSYNNFGDANVEYRFENYDNPSNPSLGMTFSILGGFKMNIDDTQRRFPYGESSLGFTYPLSSDGRLVLATLGKVKTLLDDGYEFYQANTVGGDTDMRGFRNQRFSGKHTFYQSSDVRYNLGKLRTGFVPMSYGVFAGFDYGRAWLKDDPSDKWHHTFGGGFWLNGINLITARASYFYSSDGGRVVAGLGFGF